MNCLYRQNEMQLCYIPGWTLPGQWLPDGYYCSKCKGVIAHTQE